jgi:hypothetical protein
MRPEPDTPQEALGVLNPGAARGPDGTLYLFPRLVADGNRFTIERAAVIHDPAGVPVGVRRMGVVLFPAEEYLLTGVLMTDEGLKTVQVGLSSFFGEYASDWGMIMAAATVAAIPTVVLFCLVQKRLVAGVSAGSVKE